VTGRESCPKFRLGAGALLALALLWCGVGVSRPVSFVFSASAGLGYHGVFNHGVLTLAALQGSSPGQHSAMFSLGASTGLRLFERVAPLFDLNWHTGIADSWKNPPDSRADFEIATNSLGIGLKLLFSEGTARPYLLAGKTLQYNWTGVTNGEGFRDGGGEYYVGTGLVWTSAAGWGGGLEVLLRPHTFRSFVLGTNNQPIRAQGTALSIQVIGTGIWMP
jgi:hypothetical protein